MYQVIRTENRKPFERSTPLLYHFPSGHWRAIGATHDDRVCAASMFCHILKRFSFLSVSDKLASGKPPKRHLMRSSALRRRGLLFCIDFDLKKKQPLMGSCSARKTGHRNTLSAYIYFGLGRIWRYNTFNFMITHPKFVNGQSLDPGIWNRISFFSNALWVQLCECDPIGIG